jgi:hypothetical protein
MPLLVIALGLSFSPAKPAEGSERSAAIARGMTVPGRALRESRRTIVVLVLSGRRSVSS